MWLYDAASRRVIRQAPIRSGITIHTASEVATWAHCGPLRISFESGFRERVVSSHGATPAKTDSEASAAHAVGSAYSATIAGAEESAAMPKATPMTTPATRKTAD